MAGETPEPVPPGSGQESVWDYPCPGAVEPVTSLLEVIFDGRVIAATVRGARVLERSHPPVYYFPPDDIEPGVLRESTLRRSLCGWKGWARYFDVVSGRREARGGGWCYPKPAEAFAALAGHVAFYPAAMEACRVDGEIVTPQPGEFYGGWITAGVVGPFKGGPGTSGW